MPVFPDYAKHLACVAGARKGKGDRARGEKEKVATFPFPRAPDFPSPFPFLAPATQATKNYASTIEESLGWGLISSS